MQHKTGTMVLAKKVQMPCEVMDKGFGDMSNFFKVKGKPGQSRHHKQTTWLPAIQGQEGPQGSSKANQCTECH
jgi:hypothetical protein